MDHDRKFEGDIDAAIDRLEYLLTSDIMPDDWGTQDLVDLVADPHVIMLLLLLILNAGTDSTPRLRYCRPALPEAESKQDTSRLPFPTALALPVFCPFPTARPAVLRYY